MAKLHDMRLKLLIQQEHERISKSQPNDLDLSIVQARCLCWLALLAEAHEDQANDAEKRGDAEQAMGWFADSMRLRDVTPEVEKLINMVLSDLDKEIIGVQTAERIRSGFEVAIVGAPNLGKSTLLNYLVGRDAAITSNVSGTTRDVIEVKLDLRGLPVTILDTAGIRKSDDKVEEIGISRALERSSLSDLRIVLTEDGEYPPGLKKRDTDIICIAKDDQGNRGGVSGKTGAGIDRLKNNIWDILNDKAQYVGIATRERHKSSMVNAKKFLGNAVVSLRDGPEYYDITAEEIRAATSALDSLIGRIGVEDVLDEVFSSFCLGK